MRVFVKTQRKDAQFVSEMATLRLLSDYYVPTPRPVGFHFPSSSRERVAVALTLAPGTSAEKLFGSASSSSSSSFTADELYRRHLFAVMSALSLKCLHRAHCHCVRNDAALRNFMMTERGSVQVIDFGFSLVGDSSFMDAHDQRMPYIHQVAPMAQIPLDMAESFNCSFSSDAFQFGWMLQEV